MITKAPLAARLTGLPITGFPPNTFSSFSVMVNGLPIWLRLPDHQCLRGMVGK